MEITTQLDGDEMHICLQGRLDAAWSNTVNQTLQDTLQGGCHRVALDLSQVSYLSSAGIRVLVMLVKSLKAIGGSLRLVSPSAAVSEVLQLVGFNQLLDTAAPAVDTAQKSPAVVTPDYVQLAGHEFALYTLDATATQQGRVIGADTRASLSGVKVSENTWLIGHGFLGTDGNIERCGELLAVAGLAVSLPGNDPEHPDWMQQEGGLTPEVSMLHGLTGTGTFRHLLRFGETPETPPLRLSELADAALQACAADCVSLVVVAEIAHLIGASLQAPLAPDSGDFFAFPVIRERLLFTAEPAYAKETCLVVGLAARQPSQLLAPQLPPSGEEGDLFLHTHACVVPFHPVRKGFVSLPDSLARLMDAQTLRGVLHLLNDDRDGVGAGESYLRRGALWCAPVHFDGDHA
ncbi:MAG: STAS domain-containing protein [Methylovulum sp.]|nr:STAS domain-containing protein [Methylovulum sp.]